MYDAYSELVYALKASDVRTVLVAGKVVMDERKMLTMDENQILQKAQEYKVKIVASLKNPPAN